MTNGRAGRDWLERALDPTNDGPDARQAWEAWQAEDHDDIETTTDRAVFEAGWKAGLAEGRQRMAVVAVDDLLGVIMGQLQERAKRR